MSTGLFNNCGSITTKGILFLLQNLELLERIEANKGQNSTIQQAIAILDSEKRHNSEVDHDSTTKSPSKFTSFPKMKHFLFRNPGAGLATVAQYCPNLIQVD